jgi:Mn2+/Fe2+ NRAMP family transporter
MLLLLASTIGATVTPWMVFFQQSASADKGLTPHDLKHGRIDTAVGGALAAAFGCGALIAGAALAAGHGGGIGLGGAGFPAALAHSSGHAVGAVFALGLIEAGAVAVLTISASTGYAVGECVGRTSSFNNTFREAALFYAANMAVALLAAAVILIPGAPLLSIALNANVLATVLLPVTLVFLIMLANDRELMGRWVNRPWINRLAVAIVVFVSVCGSAYGIDSFLQAIHVVGS